MLDKIVAIPRKKLVKHIGTIDPEKMEEVYTRLVDLLAE